MTVILPFYLPFTKRHYQIFDQRNALEAASLAPMLEHPFYGKTSAEISRSLTRKIIARIPPVPDEVFLPVISKAIEWLDTQANDIQNLLSLHPVENTENLLLQSELYRHRKDIFALNFSVPPGGSVPWRTPIQSVEHRLRPFSQDFKVRKVGVELNPFDTVRALCTDLRNACCIVIQALLGIRISELCGLLAEPRSPDNGWPFCLTIQPSRNGLNEIFYLRGRTYKMQQKWEEVNWVIGLRPRGSDYLPPPAKAVLILDKIFEQFRQLSGRKDLILGFNNRNGFSSFPTAYIPVSSQSIRLGQKDWIRQYVKLPDKFTDWNITSHQWRKSFAIYMVRSDSRLLRAVSNHFKHLSLAMTEENYVGNDAQLLGLIEDVALQETARVLYEISSGQISAAGKFAEKLQIHLERLKEYLSEQSEDTKIRQIENVLANDDIRMWSCDWGYCLFRPETSRCHQLANTSSIANRFPHYGKRTPGACCDCANLIVLPEHLNFWEKRYQKDLQSLEQNRAHEHEDMLPVFEERLRQSESVLLMLKRSKVVPSS